MHLTEDFDRTSRHILISRAIEQISEKGDLVLDVGGAGGFTQHLLPDHEVLTLDIQGEVNVSGSALHLPFRDDSFGVTTLVDVLEHMPAQVRSQVVKEANRVSRKGVAIAGPFASDEVVTAERRLASVYAIEMGTPHRWLEEHARFGLPSLEVVKADLQVWECLYEDTTNPLEFWALLQRLNFLVAGVEAPLPELHARLVDHYLDHGDADTPAYRHILIASAEPVASLRMRREESWDTHLALLEIDRAAATVVGHTRYEMRRVSRARDQKDEALAVARFDLSRLQGERRIHHRDVASLQQQLEALGAKRDILQSQLTAAETSLQHGAAKLADAEKKLALLQHGAAKLADAEKKLALSESEVTKLNRRVERSRQRIGQQVQDLETSRAWRLGRTITGPTRALSRNRRTGFDRIRDELSKLSSIDGSPFPVFSLADGSVQDKVSSVVRDIEALVGSRRMKIGNLLGAVAAPFTSKKGLRADLRLIEIASNLKENLKTEDLNAVKNQVHVAERALTGLESSRRWNIGQRVGNIVPRRLGRAGQPVNSRLRQTLRELDAIDIGDSPIGSRAPTHLDVHQWGRSKREDEMYLGSLYSEFRRLRPPRQAPDELKQVSVVIDCGSKAKGPLFDVAIRSTRRSLREAGIESVHEVDTLGQEWIEKHLGDDESWVLFLKPGDRVLAGEIGAITQRKEEAVVFDHAEFTGDGILIPQFKPAFSRDLLLEYDYVGRAMAVRSSSLKLPGLSVAGTHPGRSILLHLWEHGLAIGKIDDVLIHQPRQAPSGPEEFRWIEGFVEAKSLNADVVGRPSGPHLRYRLEDEPLLSIIIPFRDKSDLLRVCVDSINHRSTYRNYELILVNNQSTDPETLSYIADLRSTGISILDFDEPFNYSKANNLGAKEANGEFLVFLNNDTEVLSPYWLEELAGHAAQPGVGAVGAKLLYSNGRIQHGGVMIGLQGLAGHFLGGWHESHLEPSLTRFTRNVSAVTAACMAIKKSRYLEAGGFDEEFVMTGNDVDLCLRLLRRGYRNLWNPGAILFHFEKETRKEIAVNPIDISLSHERYEPFLTDGDPFLNPNLSRDFTRPIPELRQLIDGSNPRPPKTSGTWGFVRQYDAGSAELAANARHIERFATQATLELQSVAWFLPLFDHPYRGGIHTILRIATYLTETRGTKNLLVICSNEDWDETMLGRAISDAFPSLNFELRAVNQSQDEAELPATNAAVATLWTTAYHLLRYSGTQGKFYFIQDFEPAFNPADSTFGLVEQTYRFGFKGIANTPGVAKRYAQYGNDVISFVPGVDRRIFYPASQDAASDGPIRVVFYGRPSNPRNGFELGIEALRRVKEEFGTSVEIRSVGASYDPRAYGAERVLTNLGVLPNLESVAELYRRSHIGLVFMYTAHPSYQPLEYMASGTATVTNVNESNSWLLRHEENSMTVAPTVSSVAEAIGSLIRDADHRTRIVQGGLATIQTLDWEPELSRIAEYMEGATGAG